MSIRTFAQMIQGATAKTVMTGTPGMEWVPQQEYLWKGSTMKKAGGLWKQIPVDPMFLTTYVYDFAQIGGLPGTYPLIKNPSPQPELDDFAKIFGAWIEPIEQGMISAGNSLIRIGTGYDDNAYGGPFTDEDPIWESGNPILYENQVYQLPMPDVLTLTQAKPYITISGDEITLGGFSLHILAVHA